MISTYNQARIYLEGFIHKGIFNRIDERTKMSGDQLERIRVFLRLLGNPQDTYPQVVVSGTSGKGSTTYLIAKILTEAGYKTGLAISPHLQKINERMQINCKPISDEKFVALVNEVKSVLDMMEKTPYGTLSYYEIIMCMDILYFAKEQVDIAIVEVGLEGKYDATNVLYPLGFVLTNISLDHTAILGNTTGKIANEATWKMINLQSPIIKESPPFVITGVTQKRIIALIEKRAKIGKAILKRLGKDVRYTVHREVHAGVFFDYFGEGETLQKLHVSLRGKYQAENASLAIATVKALRSYGIKVVDKQIRNALSHAEFPGRFEEFRYKGIPLILDGAHNGAKMTAFLHALAQEYPTEKKIFLVGFKKDKDIEKLLLTIAKQADSIVVSEFRTTIDLGKNLSSDIAHLKEQVKMLTLVPKFFYKSNNKSALEKAIELARKEGALVIVTGSLYLVGEIRELLVPSYS